MKQYYPEFSKSIESLEDNFDLNAIYDILKYSAGIDIKQNSNEPVIEQAKKQDNASNSRTLDLAQ